MKKFTINIIAIAGLFITVAQVSCSVQKHRKLPHSYSKEHYHKDYNDNRTRGYEHPRYY